MGSNLALNLDDHGIRVAVYDVDAERVLAYARQHSEREFIGARSLAELVAALERPRRILILIPAGSPVDETLEALAPHLEPGDIVLDGGNSHYADTRRRVATMVGRGIGLLGVGISGGEEGARHGPSLMPGGPREAYDAVAPVLEAIAARTELGPCVGYLGPDGAGHFVKMVHNGIEYADMQAIAEAYDLLRRGAGLEAHELAAVFAEWNEGPLESFLLEITAAILAIEDPETGMPLVEAILDEAEQRGTGRSTAIAALELGVAATTVVAAVDARVVSSRRAERRRGSRLLAGPEAAGAASREALVGAARDALYATRLCAFAQGMQVMSAVSAEEGWALPRAEIARLWMAGCIIRSRLLGPIRDALLRDPGIPNLLFAPPLAREIAAAQDGLRKAVAAAAELGIPAPCWSAALAWYDASRTERLPQNLTQAQRDWFGGHRYQRLDDPEGEPVHAEWVALAELARKSSR